MLFSAIKRFSDKQRESGEIARAFFRLFNTDDGKIVLEHLHHHVMFRPTDPSIPTEQLRFLEGQRQLVLFICQTINKTRHLPIPSSPAQAGVHSPD